MPNAHRCQICNASRRSRCTCPEGTIRSLKEHPVDPRLQTKKRKVDDDSSKVQSTDLEGIEGPKPQPTEPEGPKPQPTDPQGAKPQPTDNRNAGTSPAADSSGSSKQDDAGNRSGGPKEGKGENGGGADSDSRPQEVRTKGSDYLGYYSTLGVSWTCTAAEATRAYHKLALQSHPDKTNAFPATVQAALADLFLRAAQAKKVLTTPALRADYDYACWGECKPGELPPGWTTQRSRTTGQAYYWHKETGRSTFTKPTA